MALKRIYIPTIMITPAHVKQWAKQGDEQARESLDKTTADFSARALAAEQDLNAAFMENYEVKTQYDVKAQWEEGITFILYKYDFEEVLKHNHRRSEEDESVKRMMENGAPDEETARAMHRKIEAAFDEAEEYFYPAGPDDTPHCKTCGADILYCRCDHPKSKADL